MTEKPVDLQSRKNIAKALRAAGAKVDFEEAVQRAATDDSLDAQVFWNGAAIADLYKKIDALESKLSALDLPEGENSISPKNETDKPKTKIS